MWNAGSPGPRCTSTVTSGASMPASARLATVATDMNLAVQRERATRRWRAGLLAAGRLSCLDACDAALELRKPGLRVFEKLLLHLEVLARNELEALEPAAEQCTQVLFDVLRRSAAQRLRDARRHVVEEAVFAHGDRLSPGPIQRRNAPRPRHKTVRVH